MYSEWLKINIRYWDKRHNIGIVKNLRNGMKNFNRIGQPGSSTYKTRLRIFWVRHLRKALRMIWRLIKSKEIQNKKYTLKTGNIKGGKLKIAACTDDSLVIVCIKYVNIGYKYSFEKEDMQFTFSHS